MLFDFTNERIQVFTTKAYDFLRRRPVAPAAEISLARNSWLLGARDLSRPTRGENSHGRPHYYSEYEEEIEDSDGEDEMCKCRLVPAHNLA